MENNKIIGLSGKIGSGKSTLAKLLIEYFKMFDLEAEEKFFASSLKNLHKSLTGYGGYTQEEKNIYLEDYGFTVGEGLQRIGDGLRQIYHPNVWIITALKGLPSDKIIIMSDCRYHNEADLILEKGGILVRLEGDPAEVRKNSKRDLNHSSEIDLDDYTKFDFIFNNTESISKLEQFAFSLVEFLVKTINKEEHGQESD